MIHANTSNELLNEYTVHSARSPRSGYDRYCGR